MATFRVRLKSFLLPRLLFDSTKARSPNFGQVGRPRFSRKAGPRPSASGVSPEQKPRSHSRNQATTGIPQKGRVIPEGKLSWSLLRKNSDSFNAPFVAGGL